MTLSIAHPDLESNDSTLLYFFHLLGWLEHQIAFYCLAWPKRLWATKSYCLYLIQRSFSFVRSQTNRIMCTIAIHCQWTTGVLDWLWIALHQVRSWWEGWKICQDRPRIGRETWSSYAYWMVSLYKFRPCYTILHIPFLKVSFWDMQRGPGWSCLGRLRKSPRWFQIILSEHAWWVLVDKEHVNRV